MNGLVEISRIGCVAHTMLAALASFGLVIPSSSSSSCFLSCCALDMRSMICIAFFTAGFICRHPTNGLD